MIRKKRAAQKHSPEKNIQTKNPETAKPSRADNDFNTSNSSLPVETPHNDLLLAIGHPKQLLEPYGNTGVGEASKTNAVDSADDPKTAVAAGVDVTAAQAVETGAARSFNAADSTDSAIPVDFGEAANPEKTYKLAKANASKRTRISKPESKKGREGGGCKSKKAARNTKKLAAEIFARVTATGARLRQQPQHPKSDSEGVAIDSKLNHRRLLMPPPSQATIRVGEGDNTTDAAEADHSAKAA
ncbi:hypothetical protein RUND412_000288 [Rhizina undulata]